MLWRIVAAAGGLGGLGSLLLPYAYVTSSFGGIEMDEGAYTLFELAQLIEDAGNDPTMIYGLAVVIVFGSAVALVGALAFHHLAAAGGLVQGGAAAAYWYGIQSEGTQTFFAGLGQVDATVEVGFYVLVAAAAASLLAAVVGAVTGRRGDADTGARTEPRGR